MSAPPTAHAGLDTRPRRPGNPRKLVHAILDGPLRVDERASLGVVDRMACAVLVRAWGVELAGCSL